jgi:hypothetical protein
VGHADFDTWDWRRQGPEDNPLVMAGSHTLRLDRNSESGCDETQYRDDSARFMANIGSKAGLVAGPQHQVVEARADIARDEHKRLLAKVGQRD